MYEIVKNFRPSSKIQKICRYPLQVEQRYRIVGYFRGVPIFSIFEGCQFPLFSRGANFLYFHGVPIFSIFVGCQFSLFSRGANFLYFRGVPIFSIFMGCQFSLFSWGANFLYFRGVPIFSIFVGCQFSLFSWGANFLYFRGVPIFSIFVGCQFSLFSWGANFLYFRGYSHVTKFRITNIYTLIISHKRVCEFVATDTGFSNTFIDVVASRTRRTRLNNEAFHSSRKVTLQRYSYSTKYNGTTCTEISVV